MRVRQLEGRVVRRRLQGPSHKWRVQDWTQAVLPRALLSPFTYPVRSLPGSQRDDESEVFGVSLQLN